MGWPKHKWGWVVFDGWGNPMRENNSGKFFGGGFGEVFTDRKAADWIASLERKELAWMASRQRGSEDAKHWNELREKVKVVRIALPGTYNQVQAPKRYQRLNS